MWVFLFLFFYCLICWDFINSNGYMCCCCSNGIFQSFSWTHCSTSFTGRILEHSLLFLLWFIIFWKWFDCFMQHASRWSPIVCCKWIVSYQKFTQYPIWIWIWIYIFWVGADTTEGGFITESTGYGLWELQTQTLLSRQTHTREVPTFVLTQTHGKPYARLLAVAYYLFIFWKILNKYVCVCRIILWSTMRCLKKDRHYLNTDFWLSISVLHVKSFGF